MKKYMFLKFLIRIKVCWLILTRKYDHWFIVNLSEKELIKQIEGEDYEPKVYMHGIRSYMMNKTVKDWADSISEVDMICEKANMEAEVISRNGNKK